MQSTTECHLRKTYEKTTDIVCNIGGNTYLMIIYYSLLLFTNLYYSKVILLFFTICNNIRFKQ